MVSFKLLTRPGWVACATLTLVTFAFASHAANRSIVVPMKCSKGPSDQKHTTIVKAPASVEQNAEYTVRIEGVKSDKVSHVGLNYIKDMTYEYLIPKQATLVSGSLRIVPNTGSENVRSNARVLVKARTISMVLPGH